MHREHDGLEPKRPMTPPSPDIHGALLSRGSSGVASRDSGSSRASCASSKRFERPNYLHIFLHAVVCCAAYPIIYVGTIFAKDKSLFWARLLVGLWCAGVGVTIGWSLIISARKYTEAAGEHTFTHSSPPSGCSTRFLSVLGSVGDCDPSQSQREWTWHKNEGPRG